MLGSILTPDVGSSGLKFALFGIETMSSILRGEITDLDTAPFFVAQKFAGADQTERDWPKGSDISFAATFRDLLAFTQHHAGGAGLAAVCHRIVNGGPDHIAPARVTPELIEALAAQEPLDPLHLPHNLAPMPVIATVHPACHRSPASTLHFTTRCPPSPRGDNCPTFMEYLARIQETVCDTSQRCASGARRSR